MRGAHVLALLAGLLSGCRGRSSAESERGTSPVARSPASAVLLPLDPCEKAVTRVLGLPELPGAPAFERARVEILGRARSTPVVFERAPEAPPGAAARVLGFRQELRDVADPADGVFQILKRTRRRLGERRQIFLSEGYLYAEQPHLALRLSQVLRLEHLFDQPEVLVHRGSETRLARRQDGKYYWSLPGPSSPKGQPMVEEANLLLLDRVSTVGEEVGLPLHVDLAALKAALHYDRVVIERMTAGGWVLNLQTGGVDSRAVVRAQDSSLRLECEVRGSAEVERELARARTASARRSELIAPILAAAGEIIARRLPFDEPRTEEGQQDGQLRVHFRKAYEAHQHSYEFNGDRYFVFDGFGRPLLPEVCIDFITDALEWGTGGSWAARGEGRRHRRGALDFNSFGLENPRSVEQVLDFATERPSWFDVEFLSDEERIKFVYRSRFFAALEQNPLRYQRGDVVFILGLRDDDRFHYHSFFIDQVDPLTGAPLLLAANAGPPQTRSWEGEMQGAPLRSIVARLRLKSELLWQAREQAARAPGEPLVPPTAVVGAPEAFPVGRAARPARFSAPGQALSGAAVPRLAGDRLSP